jgi:phage-related protein
MSLISEVRAKFSANADGMRSAVRGIREDLQDMTEGTAQQLKTTNAAMENFGDELNEVERNARQAQDGVKDATETFNRMDNALKNVDGSSVRMNSSLGGTLKTLVGFGAAYVGFDLLAQGVMGVGRAMIMGNADMETYQNTLTTVLKSEEKAVEMLAWAEQFAATTPFEIPDIVEATTKLETYGISAKGTLTDIGNMAAITGKPLMQAVEAVADAQTGELERLKEFGITKQMLIDKAKEMGKGEIVNAKGQVTDMKAMNEALFAVMEDRYKGGMDVASKSAKGLISNVQDSLGTMARELGKPMFEKFKSSLESIAPVMGALVAIMKGDWVSAQETLKNAFGPETALKIENFILGVLAKFHVFRQYLDTSFFPIFKNLGTIISNLSPTISFIGGVLATAFTTAIGVITDIVKKITDVGAAFSKWEGFLPVVNGIIAAFVAYRSILAAVTAAQAIQWAWTNRQMLMTKAWAAVQAFLNATLLANPIVLIIALLVGLGVALYTAYQKSETFRDIVNKVWASIKTAFQATIDWFTTTLPAWIQSVVQWFTQLWNDIKAKATEWGNALKAVWDGVKTSVSNFVNGVVTWFNNLKTIVGGIVTSFVDMVKNTFNNFVNGLMFLITPFINFFINSWENLKLMVLGIVGVLTSMLVGDFEGMKLGALAIWTALKKQIENIVTTLKDFAIRLFTSLKLSVMSIFNDLKNLAMKAWNLLKDGVVKAATALKTGAVNAWNSLKTSIISGAEALKNGAINAWNALKTGAINAVNALKTGAVNAWNSLKSSITTAVNNIKSGVTNGFNNAKTAATTAMSNMKSGISSAIETIKGFFPKMMNSIINTIKGINLKTIGSDLLKGLLNGITSGAKAVYNKAQEIADGIKSRIKKALKIHSPSRVMEGFGVNVGEGLKNGIHSMIRGVQKTSEGMADAVTGGMNFGGLGAKVGKASAIVKTESVLKHVFDLANVPDHMNESTLVQMLLKVMGNPAVKRKISKVNADTSMDYNRPLGMRG